MESCSSGFSQRRIQGESVTVTLNLEEYLKRNRSLEARQKRCMSGYQHRIFIDGKFCASTIRTAFSCSDRAPFQSRNAHDGTTTWAARSYTQTTYKYTRVLVYSSVASVYRSVRSSEWWLWPIMRFHISDARGVITSEHMSVSGAASIRCKVTAWLSRPGLAEASKDTQLKAAGDTETTFPSL